jgi:methylated-DNA-[protein]-cysteine S-methyltransferase
MAAAVSRAGGRADLGTVTARTPFGPWLLLVTADGVAATLDADDAETRERLETRLGASAGPSPRALGPVRQEVEGYFRGRVRVFHTPADLVLASTPFTRAVWAAAAEVGYGELRTYGDLAGSAGRPGAARAAGSAMRRCPIDLFVPCHRIVPAGPSLGAYGGGEGRRRFLLEMEGALPERGGSGRSAPAARR